MISRHWTGVTRPGQADAYVQHLLKDTFPRLAAIPGFVEASILRRNVEGGIEFQVVTVWESLSAISAFAGQQVGVAVVPESVQAMMTTYDERVLHYEIVDRYVPKK